MCDKFKAEQRKIGDYGVATIQGKPPSSVGATLRTEGNQAPGPVGQNAQKLPLLQMIPGLDMCPKKRDPVIWLGGFKQALQTTTQGPGHEKI